MAQLEFDDNLLPTLEALYAKRDVLRRRRLVREAVDARPGERLLDVGCGPGFYVVEFADDVGEGGAVTGVDRSAPMLAAARVRAAQLPHVTLLEGDATSLPVEDGSFDAALTVQVLEYVDDAAAALGELRRALRPGGRLTIWDVDWATLSMHTSERERMDEALRAWDSHLAHPSLPRVFAPLLRAAGFEDVRVDGHAFTTAEFDPEAYGVALLGPIEEYLASHPEIGEEAARAWADEQRELGARGEFYSSCVQVCCTARARVAG
jgi:ubiquinone/menaquinone biosynthesis C-methylase UbiE